MKKVIKKIFFIKNSLFFFILASFCSIFTNLLCMGNSVFKEWFRSGLLDALGFKILLLFLWVYSFVCLGLYFYRYNWKNNLLLLLQVFGILLITLISFL